MWGSGVRSVRVGHLNRKPLVPASSDAFLAFVGSVRCVNYGGSRAGFQTLDQIVLTQAPRMLCVWWCSPRRVRLSARDSPHPQASGPNDVRHSSQCRLAERARHAWAKRSTYYSIVNSANEWPSSLISDRVHVRRIWRRLQSGDVDLGRSA